MKGQFNSTLSSSCKNCIISADKVKNLRWSRNYNKTILHTYLYEICQRYRSCSIVGLIEWSFSLILFRAWTKSLFHGFGSTSNLTVKDRRGIVKTTFFYSGKYTWLIILKAPNHCSGFTCTKENKGFLCGLAITPMLHSIVRYWHTHQMINMQHISSTALTYSSLWGGRSFTLSSSLSLDSLNVYFTEITSKIYSNKLFIYYNSFASANYPVTKNFGITKNQKIQIAALTLSR